MEALDEWKEKWRLKVKNTTGLTSTLAATKGQSSAKNKIL